MRDNILFLFDIDGTMIDSTKVDDVCFIETFRDLFAIDLQETNWAKYTDVTDRGLSEDIIQKHLNRKLSADELNDIESHFFGKMKAELANSAETLQATVGLMEFLEEVSDRGIYTAIATGGWRRPADLKLNIAKIPYHPFTLASSNDARSRRSIMNIAIGRARYEYQVEFDQIIYFGDGVWDAKVSREMEIPMVGVDIENRRSLSNETILCVVHDFSDSRLIFDSIGV